MSAAILKLLAVIGGLSTASGAGSVVSVTNETFRSVIDGSDYVLLEVCVPPFLS